MLSEELFEVAAVAVLIDKVIVIGCFEHVDVADDVGVGVERGQNVHLVESALFQLGTLLELGRVNHLNGYLFLRLHVDCLVDGGVGSLADLSLQVVVLDDLTHQMILLPSLRHQ